MNKYFIFSCITIILLCSNVSAATTTSLKLGDSGYLMTRGDSLQVTGNNFGYHTAYVWIFGYSISQLVYEPIQSIGTEYFINLPWNKIKNLRLGDFQVVVQLCGKNDVCEANYNSATNEYFNPWKGIRNVTMSDSPTEAKKQLIELINNSQFSDDVYDTFYVKIEEPWIRVTGVYPIQNNIDPALNGKLFVGGETNMGSPNKIYVTVDHGEKAEAAIESMEFAYSKWHAIFSVEDPREYQPGVHYVDIESDQLATISTTFTISEYIPTPTPTPVPIRKISSKFMPVTTVVPGSNPTQVVIAPAQPQKFVPIVTTPVDTPLPAPSGAKYIAPVKTNVVEHVEVPVTNPPGLTMGPTVPPTPPTQSSLDIIPVIVAIDLAIFYMGKK